MSAHGWSRLAILSVITCLSLQAHAGNGSEKKVPPPPPNQVKPVGEYSGLKVGVEGFTGVKKRGKRPRVTWVGFQPLEGGTSRAFIQVDREVSFSQEVRGQTLVLILEGAVFANRNARRPLDTRFFDSAVARVEPAKRSRKRGRRVELAVHFKNPLDAREAAANSSTGKDGFTYVTFEFGPLSSGSSGQE